jgi:hypothetical protein
MLHRMVELLRMIRVSVQGQIGSSTLSPLDVKTMMNQAIIQMIHHQTTTQMKGNGRMLHPPSLECEQMNHLKKVAKVQNSGFEFDII